MTSERCQKCARVETVCKKAHKHISLILAHLLCIKYLNTKHCYIALTLFHPTPLSVVATAPPASPHHTIVYRQQIPVVYTVTIYHNA